MVETADWARRFRKAGYAGPRLVVSTLIVLLLVGPVLPDWAGLVLFYGGLTVGMLLVAGVGESLAVRMLFGARRLTASERTGLAEVDSELCHLELGPPLIEVFVARRRGAPAAASRGRRSVVVAAELVHGILTGQLPHREAVAVLAHASLITRCGLTRQDPAIAFWSTPWRMLAVLGRPLHGLLGFAWKIRFVVVGIAIWQSLSDGARVSGPLAGPLVAFALALLLALTYLVPHWTASWEKRVYSTGDREVTSLGLGPATAAFLRRYPQTPPMIERIQLLDPPIRQRPNLRVVGV